MSTVKYVNSDTFEAEVLKAQIPVLVDFTASWCGPCKMLAPVVEALAEEWEGKIKVVKLDVDNDKDKASEYGIMSVPTLLLFVDGEKKERLTGFRPKRKLVKKFKGYL